MTTETSELGFLGLEDPELTDPKKAKVVVVPVPYEGTTTYHKGTEGGPAAILLASHQVELYDDELDSEVYEIGVHTTAPVDTRGTPEQIPPRVADAVRPWAQQKKFVVTLGGEHTASVGSVWAYRDVYPDVHVLQFDAHADLRPAYGGTPFNHACAAARMCENKYPLTQVGIRNYSRDEAPFVNTGPTRTFFAREMRDPAKWIPKVMETLGQTVYITIDVDGFDPSVFPGTGTPEPGGIGWYDGLALLKEVARTRTVVGLDVVEVTPTPGQVVSEFAAAKLIYKVLGYVFHEKKRG